MRFSSLKVGAMLIVGILSLVPTSVAFSTHIVNGDLLPDPLMLEPRDFLIEVTTPGEKRLRYDFETVNAHTGPLEVFSTRQRCRTDLGMDGRRAYQRIYLDGNGNGYFERGIDTASRTRLAGCMEYHRQHHHQHITEFYSAELWALGTSGTRTGSSALAASPKATFCLADVHRRQDLFAPDLLGSPLGAYYNTCDRTTPQGLSVAWSDEYPNYTSGQYLVITGLANGEYCFVARVDPLAKFEELTRANNEESVRIQLSGTSVTGTAGSSC